MHLRKIRNRDGERRLAFIYSCMIFSNDDKARVTKIVNFMTPRAEDIVLGVAIYVVL